MRRIIKIICLFGGLAVSGTGLGQIPDSLPQRNDMVGEILVDINRTKIAPAMEMGLDFASYWDSGGLSSQQKNQIENIYHSMLERKMPADPYLLYFIGTISLAGGNELIQLSAMTRILEMTGLVLKNEGSEDVRNYFRNLNAFLAHKSLHYSNGFKLLVDNIDFDFDYVASGIIDKIPEETVTPEPEKPEDDQSGEGDSSGLEDWDEDSWESPQISSSDPGSWETSWDSASDADDQTTADGNWINVPGTDNAGNDKSLIESIVDVPVPEEKGPVIRFKSTDLIFLTHYDTISLESAKGFFSLTDGLFVGDGGTFNWSSVGLNSRNVFCKLGKYAFETTKPELISTKSRLTFSDKIDAPVEGTFAYRSIKRRPGVKSTYPRFTSYDHKIRVYYPGDKNLIFRGGFSLSGDQVFSNSLLKKNSILEVQDETGILFRALSPKFGLSDSLITSKNAAIKIYHGRDSISHPEVELRYDPDKRELLVYRNEGVYRITPYRISYFDMDVAADMINWDLDEDSLDISISSARNIVPAYFESNDFFNKNDMKSLAGIYDFHPLIMVVQYARKIRSKNFNVFDMAQELRQNEKEVNASMVGIMQNGFIEYNSQTSQIFVKEKAFHYVDANRFQKDYDDLRIKSLSPMLPNATIRLDDKEMTIRGIERFNVSETLGVFIFPKNSEITVLKDRDLKFNGQLYAGNFEFIGQEFLFKYDSFYVDLSQIDSIRFYIDDMETGQKKMVDNKLIATLDSAKEKSMSGLAQTFDGSSGRLYINRPDNKSGQKIYPTYPKFNAAQGAIVYFDNKEVLDGAYDQSIYFIIPPFEIDSLSGSDPASIGFDGIFVAEGMLPSFQETLHIMDDNSLGFKHTIPAKGYELFSGNGKIYDTLRLDHHGLTASGTIEYMTASLESDKFTFYIDSLTGSGKDFLMTKGVMDGGSFPDAYVNDFRLKWFPKKDSMYITNIEHPFNLYDSSATLDGTFVVNSAGGFGQGTLLTRGALASSEEFSFNESRFGAHHATFEISSDNQDKPALSGEDIRLDFNLIENFADIGPEIEGMAAINFPYAQFKTSISNARWYLDDRTVVMNKPDDVDIHNSYFYATREELDSLSFNASRAVYNMDKLELLVSGIPYIKVADAKITPENNEVLILENARIGTLYNTAIVIDTLYEFHKLYDGTIDIVSRNEFTGTATYQFVNAVSDTFALKIDEFLLVPENARGRQNILHTQARGYVTEDNGVVISPGLVYKGEAIMYAPDPAFKLNGYVKLQYRSNPLEDLWIRYESSETETQNVEFDFDLARTEDDQKITAGLHYDEHDALYATYVNDKKSFMDKDFFIPKGILTFDPDSSVYRIEDTLKVSGQSFSGRIFNLNVNTSDILFEGPVNFNVISKDFELNGAVIGKGNIEKNVYGINAFLTMNFDLPSQALLAMSQDMLEVIDMLGIPVGYGDDSETLYKLAEIIGERPTVDYEKKSLLEYTPMVDISPQLLKTIVIPKINLTWTPEHKAWYNTGKIALSNIMRVDVNALVDGFLEIKKNENGDVINLFLQFSPGSWYFFNFEENRIITASSNDAYIDAIAGKTNALKADFGDYFYL
ncbi:MAG: hypothetical protein KFF73_01940, partial [Cyclobacteriaceae bacterium]|nr:hypothetical protein [Cyclobacteriaceae bacterium]